MIGAIQPILLQAESAAREPGLQQMLLLFGPIFLIMYFLVIRPQNKKQRELETLRKSLAKGDAVITSGGIHGRVVGVEGEVVTLEIAQVKGDRVRIQVSRASIETRAPDPKAETKADAS